MQAQESRPEGLALPGGNNVQEVPGDLGALRGFPLPTSPAVKHYKAELSFVWTREHCRHTCRITAARTVQFVIFAIYRQCAYTVCTIPRMYIELRQTGTPTTSRQAAKNFLGGAELKLLLRKEEGWSKLVQSHHTILHYSGETGFGYQFAFIAIHVAVYV